MTTQQPPNEASVPDDSPDQHERERVRQREVYDFPIEHPRPWELYLGYDDCDAWSTWTDR